MSSLIFLFNTLVDETPTLFPYLGRYFFLWIVLFTSLSNDLRGVLMKSINTQGTFTAEWEKICIKGKDQDCIFSSYSFFHFLASCNKHKGAALLSTCSLYGFHSFSCLSKQIRNGYRNFFHLRPTFSFQEIILEIF